MGTKVNLSCFKDIAGNIQQGSRIGQRKGKAFKSEETAGRQQSASSTGLHTAPPGSPIHLWEAETVPDHVPVCAVGPVCYPVYLSTSLEDLTDGKLRLYLAMFLCVLWDLSAILCACPHPWRT
ncbi:hypothetical protein Bbelb_251920 [Branchiostoma belcheri]|nr:hypothetical protein Bbelb_251920 [Branchiostoma belcheri]